MSREIKFDFVYKGETGFHHKKYYIEDLVANSLAKLSDFHHQMELVAIRQFTGLLDMDSVDVYEKDILEGFCGNKRIVSVMEWVEEEGRYSTIHPLSKFRVIGNIHEHPELLEQK